MTNSIPTPQPAVSPATLANAIRVLAIDGVEQAKSGHPGLPMGMADVAAVLFSQFLNFDPAKPDWADRDRFVLSAGHGSMLLYALAHLTGYAPMTLDQLRSFRQLGSITPGHPEHDLSIGVETTTGPLGQGLGNAVGMALAERMMNARHGDALVDHRTYVIASDGDLMEGISHEAASLAGHLGLNRLVVLYDHNGISIDGPTSLSFTDDTLQRFKAYGWAVGEIDGHDHAAIAGALAEAQKSDKPVLIACRTVIGYGAPKKAGTRHAHGEPLGAEELAGAKTSYGWQADAFHVSEEIRAEWSRVGGRGRAAREAWEARLAQSAGKADFEAAISGALPGGVAAALAALKATLAGEKPKIATRVASGRVIEALNAALPTLIGGSADLTPSNNSQGKTAAAVQAGDYAGRYIHWGIREHGMVAALNGMALHGGLIPFGATFLTFTDYCRPSIRLAALMKQRVILVMTHDSIGLGEDGPTHQPVEHIAALRTMPNVLVLRPADAIETLECWQIALERDDGPTILALTRQGLPALRSDTGENRSAAGAYLLADAEGAHKVTLIASGSEVEIAMTVRAALAADGIGARVVSMPGWGLADVAATRALIGTGVLRVGIEAGVGFGWEKWIGEDGIFCGVDDFGISAPYQKVYEHFGLTTDAIAAKVKARLSA